MKRTLNVSIAALLVTGACAAALHFGTANAQETGEVKQYYPDIQTAEHTYTDGGDECIGYVAWDDNLDGERPVVLIVHDWMGRGSYDEARAREIASLGYLAFSLDVYGTDVRPTNRAEASEAAGTWRGGDNEAFRQRLKAGMDAALEHELADTGRVAAIGYCFGGSAVMQLARSGANLRGVVPFHGGYSTEPQGDARDIRGKVLILHGADDKFEGIVAINEELREAGVNYEIDLYGHAVHSFSNPAAGDDPSTGNAYDAQADKRSWERMKDFFTEIFNEQ